jgi:hypothetical protein
MRNACVLLAILSFLTPRSLGADRVFRAGAAMSNVTPPLGCSINGGFVDHRGTNIHDELHARCLVLDDDTPRLAIVVVDSCMIPKGVVDAAKETIASRTKIPPDHVLISATHTHEAPAATPLFQSVPDPAYPPFLAMRIADGVERAAHNLANAQIGWNVTTEPSQVFNRRWKVKPGPILTNPFGTADLVKMNPPPGSADLIEPAGPTDPQVWVLSVRRPDGTPVALLANYSLHYVGGEAPGDVSADYYGMFATRVAESLKPAAQLPRDEPFVAIMSNATSGDINNINFREPRPVQKPYVQMHKVADALAAKAVEAAGAIQYRDWVGLSAKTDTLQLAVRKPSAADVDRAKGILARSPGGPTAMQLRPEGVYAKETLAVADYPDAVPVVLQAMRIGDLAIAAIPCEVFAEIGLDLKRRSPIKPMFTIELANGYNGYLPTPEQHKQGGYETWRAKSSYLEVEASTKITSKVLELLEAVK